MKKVFLITCALFFSSSIITLQAQTKEELNVEREVLKADRKSEAYQKRQQELAELKAPSQTTINSIDGLAGTSTTSLAETVEINALLPELYKRTIGETMDGVTDITVKKPTIEELNTIAEKIGNTGKSVAESTTAIAKAESDIKSAGILKAAKATKSLNYSKKVNSLLGFEIAYQTRLIKNLISTLKSSNNL